MANFFGTGGSDSITGTGSTGFGGGVLSAFDTDVVFGNDGADTVLGVATNNAPQFVFGGGGNDSIVGGGAISPGGGSGSVFRGEQGDDTIIAAAQGFSQILDGGSGNDSLVGSAQQDLLLGGLGNDTILGGAGHDTIHDLGGSNVIDAGIGNDTVDVAGSGGANDIKGGEGQDLLIAVFTDGANTMDGGDANDTILGGAGSERLLGGAGDDQIDGGNGGNNTILGGAGNDVLVASFGNDSFEGQDGNDTVFAGGGNDIVLGGAGNDAVSASLGNDSLSGGEGNDSLAGEVGSDTISGGAGNDIVDGGDGGDSLNGDEGNDRIFAGGSGDTVLGSTGNDTADGGEGFDTLDYSALGPNTRVVITNVPGFFRVTKHDTLAATLLGVDSIAGFESFVTGGGDDRLFGSGLDETFTPGGGNDLIDGGDGFDTLRYDAAPGNVNANLATGVVQDGYGGTDRIRFDPATPGRSSIESLVAGAGDDTLTADGFGTWLRGREGNDQLNGGAGFDFADWSGDSTLPGGVLANLGGTTVGGVASNTARHGAFTDTLGSIEGLRGTDAADTLIGSNGDNLLRGQRGADQLDGGLGYDTADYRNDTDLNGDGFGVIVNLSDGPVTIPSFGAESNVAVGARRGRDGWGDLDTLAGIEGARGSFQNDVLIGTSRTPLFTFGGVDFYETDASTLRGMFGADTLIAADADDLVIASYRDETGPITARLDLGNTVQDGFGTTDTLVNVTGIEGTAFDDLIVFGPAGGFARGRGGNDTVTGGVGFDRLSYALAAGAVAVDLLAGTAQDGDGGTDSLSGMDLVSGSRFADTITGDDDGNVLLGLAGADLLIGGAGQDFVSYHSATLGPTTPIHFGVSVNLGAGRAFDGDGSSAAGSRDTLVSIEHAIGSAGADTIIGSVGDNSIHGAQGDDTIFGASGNDLLAGGGGNDTLDGFRGNDTTDGGAGDDLHLVDSRFDVVIEAAGGGADTVSTTIAYRLDGAAEVEALILTGSAAVNLIGSNSGQKIIGNSGANRLDGLAGDDDLFGLAGADTLFGGPNADTLTGHDGADVFLYDRSVESYRAGIDRIMDLEAGLDDVAFVGLPNRLFAGVAPVAVAFNGAVAVVSAALGAGNNLYLEVLEGLNAALGGSGNVTASGATLQVWQIDVAGGSAAGSYLFVNDGIAGAAPLTDMLIGVTVIGGPLGNGDLILV